MTEEQLSASEAGSQRRDRSVGEFGTDFPVIGIGASAGGLTALQTLFGAMPSDSGAAFAIVQHMQPDRQSLLPELLAKYTDMPVIEVNEAGMTVEPNHVYVIAPDRNMALFNYRLFLLDVSQEFARHLTIDYLFRSLADDQTSQAIGIVLSGTGTDGTVGVRAIKAQGGMVMAQSPDQAEFNGMPQSAIDTGLVDYVLPTDAMPQQLLNYLRHQHGLVEQASDTLLNEAGDQIEKILLLVRGRTSYDFSGYKPTMLLRRIRGRLKVNQLDGLASYVRFLQEEPGEVEKLFKELLIGVSSFFRDPESFEALAEKVIPEIVSAHASDEEIRVWVPGCATGEEAYSIAILLDEEKRRRGITAPVRIFATDLDSDAIEVARHGVYPVGIAADVSAERIETYFQRVGDGAFQVRDMLREMVIFAEQSVVKDPPFARLDLVSCRNLLIYFNAELQKQVITLFHYALNPGGYLFIGTSESLGSLEYLYELVDGQAKIYLRVGGGERPNLPFPFLTAHRGDENYARQVVKHRRNGQQEIAQQMAEARFVPPYLVANRMGDILILHGDMSPYLSFPSGKAEMNIAVVARKGLRAPLAITIRRALDEGKEVRLERMSFQEEGLYRHVTLTGLPLKHETDANVGLVFFETVPEEPARDQPAEAELSEDERIQIATLEQELLAIREYMQTSAEDMEAAYEELQSYNEELLSTNEELLTSKEELQSIHEEVMQKHESLEAKVNDLATANNNMQNLLASIDFGIMFLNLGLEITVLNKRIQDFVNVTEDDIGRPLVHFTAKLDGFDLVEEANQVLDTLEIIRREVELPDGDWVQIHLRPYRTVINAIEGVVVTIIDIPDPAYADRTVDDAD